MVMFTSYKFSIIFTDFFSCLKQTKTKKPRTSIYTLTRYSHVSQCLQKH